MELHHASDNDYFILHQAMEAEGFSRLIQGGNGVWYHLPTAEYNCTSSYGIEAVRTAAQRAANRTGRSHSVLVTEGAQRAWIGLQIVQHAHR